MPEIVFDGRKVTVPAGTNLVDAGALAGSSVPIFCYHKDLGAVGSCRICAVTVTQNDKSRTVMGCMTEAADGMEVTTLDPQSRELRKWVTEWLMVNHPHDCPICDEGGECQLQDLTIATEHGIRRTTQKKRTFANQYLGEFIAHEMNRCITCYRCSRFYQEYAGGHDFGPTGSRDRVYFGRFEEGPFESPFSGNLVELCPTGVFTDKLFRYKSRVWDLEMAPSVCPHCSVGCNILPGARHRMLQRVRVRENAAVNGTFLCDRGQFGHGYVMDPERPMRLRLHGNPAEWNAALAVTGASLVEIARQHGPTSVALIASPRASVETHFALESLAAGPLGGARVSHFDDPDREARALASLDALATVAAAPLEQSDLGHCDVLVIVGASLVNEAPLAALGARQCARRGGKVFVISPHEALSRRRRHGDSDPPRRRRRGAARRDDRPARVGRQWRARRRGRRAARCAASGPVARQRPDGRRRVRRGRRARAGDSRGGQAAQVRHAVSGPQWLRRGGDVVRRDAREHPRRPRTGQAARGRRRRERVVVVEPALATGARAAAAPRRARLPRGTARRQGDRVPADRDDVRIERLVRQPRGPAAGLRPSAAAGGLGDRRDRGRIVSPHLSAHAAGERCDGGVVGARRPARSGTRRGSFAARLRASGSPPHGPSGPRCSASAPATRARCSMPARSAAAPRPCRASTSRAGSRSTASSARSAARCCHGARSRCARWPARLSRC
jgi:NADH-quinone oxidoreductase subunit G